MRKKNKAVLFLSNLHHSIVISDDVHRKPKIILDYNRYKSGVDSLDQKISAFRPYRTTRRWPCVIFFDLLAYSLQATWVIYCLKYPNSQLAKHKNRKEFLYQLGLYLTTPVMKKRKLSADYKYLHLDVKHAIDYMLNLTDSFSKFSANLSHVHTQGESISSIVKLSTSTELASPLPLTSTSTVFESPLPTSSISMELASSLPTSSIDTELTLASTTSSTSTELASLPTSTTFPTEIEIRHNEVPQTKLLRGRCSDCPRNRDKKVKTSCFCCHKLVCREHSRQFTTCLYCEDNIYFN